MATASFPVFILCQGCLEDQLQGRRLEASGGGRNQATFDPVVDILGLWHSSVSKQTVSMSDNFMRLP